MARRSSILAADADRDRVAEQLRQAAVEGRIFAHELEERLGRALSARTYGELDALVADLPSAAATTRPRSRTARVASAHPVAAVAVLVAMTIVLLVVAAVVMAGLFAFSGAWILLAVIVFARHGMWYGGDVRSHHHAYHGRRGHRPYSLP